MGSKGPLQREIEKITEEMLPMHMPGHKRRLKPSDCLPYDWDITEISGADDLHDADGILLQAMERAATLWGSRRTWFLVGGSTCGILAAIRAAVPFGSEIIAARNCHRSVYHAIELGGYKVHWIMPGKDRRFGINGPVTPEQVRSALRKHPCSAAVILTSPTYEGVVSDVRAIADLCHRESIPLIVDEAHGAHFGLFEEGGFPESAVRLGADAVVQSVHKTLPSLTQTALLHLGGDLIGEKEIERQLGIFETSSPSYPLMISIDSCVQLLMEEGPELFEAWRDSLDEFYLRAEELERIQVLGGGGTGRDRSKILISFSALGLTGAEAAGILREQYGIETEMVSGSTVLAMTGCGDTRETVRYLADALSELDKAPSARRADGTGRPDESGPGGIPAVRTACRILDAVTGCSEEVPMGEAAGRICGEYLYIYPPGIPILAPGEYIDSEHLRIIRQAEADGAVVRHTHAEGRRTIVCLEE